MNLDKDYKISSDKYSWVLIFSEPRVRDKVKGGKKTGEIENFIFEDFWYFPKIKDCLSKYVELALRPCQNLVEMSEKIEKINKLILSIEGDTFSKIGPI